MTNATFTTARGAKIEIAIVTKTPNLADANVTNECYELVLRINGEAHVGGLDLVNDATHGLCIKPYIGRITIPVPAEAADAVTAVVAEYRAEKDARHARNDAAEADYQARRDAMRQRMGY